MADEPKKMTGIVLTILGIGILLTSFIVYGLCVFLGVFFKAQSYAGLKIGLFALSGVLMWFLGSRYMLTAAPKAEQKKTVPSIAGIFCYIFGFVSSCFTCVFFFRWFMKLAEVTTFILFFVLSFSLFYLATRFKEKIN